MKPVFPLFSLRQALCATVFSLAAAGPGHAAEAGAAAAAIPVAAPQTELTYESLLGILVSEMALQSGDLRTSAHYYAQMASLTRDVQVAQRALEIAQAAGMLPEALTAARQWAQSAPGTVEAEERLIGLLLLSQKADEARSRLTRHLHAHPERAPQLFITLGLWLDRASAGNTPRLPLIQSAAADYPQLPEANYAIAAAALHDNQATPGLNAIEKALRDRPRWPEAALVKAGLLQLGNVQRAIDWINTWQKRHQLHPLLNSYLARLYLSQEKVTEARQTFERQLKLAPRDAYAAYAAGLIAREQGDHAAAVRFLTQAQERGYRDGDAVSYHLGESLAQTQQLDAALQALDSVGPGEWQYRALSRATELRLQHKRHDEALRILQAARKQDTSPEVWQIESGAWRQLQDLPRAVDTLNEGLKQHPDDEDLLYARAMLLEKLGQLVEAEADLRLILRKLPDDATALNALGYLLADRTDRLQEAQEMIEKAHAQKPDDPFILDSLGWVYVRLGKLEQGLLRLQSAYAKRSDPEIAAHLVENLWLLGRKDEAQTLWQNASRQHPQHEALKNVQKRLLDRP